MDIYSATIMDHYQCPRHKGALSNPTVRVAQYNASCGDMVVLDLLIEKHTLTSVGFEGEGCAISQAGVSLLLEHIQGKKMTAVKKIASDEVLTLLGMQISPGRMKCALLGFAALQDACAQLSLKKI